MRNDNLKKTRTRRNYRARKKIFGSPERPRMTVFRSNKHIYVQIRVPNLQESVLN